ncbi:hypothetical protein [Streptomyces sp. NPDC059564]|uniref:hypothetical protein n=1 Tax=Streptomyces sp. NPDC059564 TaxID=3346865 RepID=UPI0036C07058
MTTYRTELPGTNYHLSCTLLQGNVWVTLQEKGSGIRISTWSRPASATPSGDFKELTEQLREKIKEIEHKAGEQRRIVSQEHLFFEGWSSWGPGTPRPLLDTVEQNAPAGAFSTLEEILADSTFWITG